MTEWVDFAVYAAFLATIWIIYPKFGQRLLVPMLTDRNPRWVAENPEAVRKIERNRWRLWLSYLLGCVSLALLLYLQLEGKVPPHATTPYGAPLRRWMLLWEMSMMSMVVGMVLMGVLGAIAWKRLTRMIPVASRRQATLERRRLDDFIPRSIRYTAYGLAGISLAAWTYVGIAHLYSTPLFWTRYGILIGLTVVFIFFTGIAVNRRPNTMDRIFGPGNRRAEVWFNFTCQFLPPLVGAVRLYEEVNHTGLMDINRAISLALALMIIYGLLRTIHLTPKAPSAHAALEDRPDLSKA